MKTFPSELAVLQDAELDYVTGGHITDNTGNFVGNIVGENQEDSFNVGSFNRGRGDNDEDEE